MQAFRRELTEGLAASPKSISPKWLYDAKGSELFEDITRLPEYYPTRQERALLRRVAPTWAKGVGPDATLVELGSGASEKTRIVLDALPALAAYIPLDISQSALEEAAASIRADYPKLDVRPVLGDFSALPSLPDDLPSGRRVGFFPGSTLGNLERDEAVRLLASSRRMLGEDALFILGVDLIKDRETLEAAYDDAQGVTARFNLNLLERANRELGTDFELTAFRHRAVWNEACSRIEMHLEAVRDTQVTLDGMTYDFAGGETLHTESSRKFSRDQIEQLASASGWSVRDWAQSDAPSVALAVLAPA
ncbi:L-histidine N(alpha)-methyltransferase [Brevundimonas sp. GN22]